MPKLIPLMLLLCTMASAESADEIMCRVDKNQEFSTQRYSASMNIQKGTRSLHKTFHGYARHEGSMAFVAFTNAEDRGVKYLKISGELWIYFPDADNIMKISGHMLRQGMMGSDISYEDMLESDDFTKKYDATLAGQSEVDGAQCHVLDLRARVKNASYERQVLYVDRERYVPLKVEKYAKGGRMIKVLTLYDYIPVNGRLVPKKCVFSDLRKKDSRTIMVFDSVTFDVPLGNDAFSRRSLRK